MSTDRRVALVTGANRGIGRAIAHGLSKRGEIRVLAAARSAAGAHDTAEALGGAAVGIVLDLSDPQEVAARAKAIEAEHGPVDILINNAGVLYSGDALNVDVEALDISLRVNTMAPFALTQVFGAGMKARNWGRVVNVSSGWGSFSEGLAGPAAYSISKAALNAVTVSTAQALGHHVKVNALCPGWVRTRMGGQSADRSPEEGADTALWLATLPDDGPTGGFFRDRQAVEW
ncbi:MAG: SDR family NAD(P)-dependent oxidoreductase [Pseudomonadota bacterium]